MGAEKDLPGKADAGPQEGHDVREEVRFLTDGLEDADFLDNGVVDAERQL